MKLILVRHGWPDEGHEELAHDPPLRADGFRQARAVAEQLAREHITHIVSSPQLRARQTAEATSERLGLPIRTLDGWAEADRHLPRYRSVDTLRSQGDSEWQRFLADPLRYLGVDADVFRAGVLDALATTVEYGGADGHTAVFTHGLPISLVLSHALGLDRLVRFGPGYASISRLLVRDAGSIGVVSINETGHHAWPRVSNA